MTQFFLIRREFPANKPNKEGVYLTNQGEYWFVTADNENNFQDEDGNEHEPEYWYEPLTIDGDEYVKQWLDKYIEEHPLNVYLDKKGDRFDFHVKLLEEFSASRVEEKPEIDYEKAFKLVSDIIFDYLPEDMDLVGFPLMQISNRIVNELSELKSKPKPK